MDNLSKDWIEDINTIITLGTQDGLIDIEFTKINPSISIYSFEPRERYFYTISKNLNIYNIENIIVLNNALANFIGQIKVINNQNDPIHFVLDDGTIIKNNDVFECITIDSLKLLTCDLIYIELNGFEYISILGGINTIRKFKPKIIISNKYPKIISYSLNNDDDKSLIDILTKLEYEISKSSHYTIFVPITNLKVDENDLI